MAADIVRTAALERLSGVTAVATAGITNSSTVGTINAIAVLRGRLQTAAIVEAVRVVTEAKVAALRDLDVRADARPPTGASTDAAVVAAEDRGEAYNYCGPATPIGPAVGRATYRGVLVDIHRQSGLVPERPIQDRLAERVVSATEIAAAGRARNLSEAMTWESLFALD